MPVTKQAKKKLRKDIKREKENDKIRKELKKAVKNSRVNPSAKKLSLASKIIDKASKKGIIHKNKAARIKSRLARLAKAGKSSPKAK